MTVKSFMIPIVKSGIFDEGAYSYITIEDATALWLKLSSRTPIDIKRTGRVIGHINSFKVTTNGVGSSAPTRYVLEAECFIHDDQTIALPTVYTGQFVRQSLVDDGYVLTSNYTERIAPDAVPADAPTR